MSSRSARPGRVALTVLVGALLGVLALHPITMVIYWFEFQRELAASGTGLWAFLGERMWLSFTTPMLPMNGIFALLGGGAGLAFAGFQRALSARERATRNLREVLVSDLPQLIAGGETEKIEFKTSLRWDHTMKSVNRSLEAVGAKTIAGFFNARGGSLVLGVNDQGQAVGLERDFSTLKRSDRDGYQQFLTGVVVKRLGGDLCTLVHFAFTSVEQLDVCRVVVEPSHRPVYVEEDGAATLYLRMGNSTRRLDVREAVEYVARRWPPPSPGSSLSRWLARSVVK